MPGSSTGTRVVIADLAIGRSEPVDPLPDRYWVEPMGMVGELLWRYQGVHGRRWYRRQPHRLAMPMPRIEP